MKNRKKYLIGGFLLTIGLMIIALLNGFYLMAVEDHYGDFQDIYFKSEDGDLAINYRTGEIGTLIKKDQRLYVVQNEKLNDLIRWIDYELEDNQIKVYRRLDNDLEIEKVDPTRIVSLVKTNKIKLVIEK